MDKILVAVDGSEHSFKAIDTAARIGALTGAELLLFAVRPSESAEELEAYARTEHLPRDVAQLLSIIQPEFLERAAERARANGAVKVSVEASSGDPASKILAATREHNVDLIVVGSRGLGRLSGLLLGSVSQKLASHAPCSLLIVR